MTLISPFVGRIYDWLQEGARHRTSRPTRTRASQSVTRIYNYFKKFGYKTQVMGASFRKVEQIVRLAGCDLLTISPDLLEKLQNAPGEVTPRLTAEAARASGERASHSTRRPSAGCTTRTRWRSRS